MITMRVPDVAKRLEVSKSTVYALIDAGKLRCTRHGLGRGAIRISEEQLAAYLETANGRQVRERLKHLTMK